MRNWKKRLFTLVLTLCMAVVLLPMLATRAEAADYSSGDYTYTIESGVAAIKKYSGRAASVTVPTTVYYDGISYRISEIQEKAFESNAHLQSITLPEAITKVGNCAFKNCTSLTSVTINGDLADCDYRSSRGSDYDYSVFYNAGRNASGITVTFGNGVTRIPACLFATGHDKTEGVYARVTEVSIPYTVKEVRERAFNRCYDLRSITFEGHAPQFEEDAFWGVSAVAKYPRSGNWPSSIFQDYGGNLTWQATGSKNPFRDLNSDSYYYFPVQWAAEEGITAGVASDRFDPYGNCTRAQVVTLLWRTAGCPEPKGTASFVDVPAGKYYAKAVAWAVENGITYGVSADRFDPNGTCTRGQIVTFLWRAAGSPAPQNGYNPFSDVYAGSYYEEAVLWAVENGITYGTSSTAFSPKDTCTRGQIVTFLFRFAY